MAAPKVTNALIIFGGALFVIGLFVFTQGGVSGPMKVGGLMLLFGLHAFAVQPSAALFGFQRGQTGTVSKDAAQSSHWSNWPRG